MEKPRYKHLCQGCFVRDSKMEFSKDSYGYWHYRCECGHEGTFIEAKEVKPYWIKGE